jgi:serine phosphatase RsbU (regulator of sigma subunit)
MYFSREWLEKKLASLETEEEKLWAKISFLSSAADLLPELCAELCLELRQKAERDNFPPLLAYVLVFEAYRTVVSQGTEDFRAKMNEAERIAKSSPPSMYTAMVLQMRAFGYWAEGQRDIALALSYEAKQQMLEEAGEPLGWTDYQLAVFHSDLKEYDKALEYFDYSETVAIAKEAVYQLARIRSGKASIAIAQNRIDEALRLNELAIEGYRSCGHHTAMSRALNDLGVICFKQGKNEKGKAYLSEAMEIRRKSNYWPGLTTTQIELARIYLSESDYSRALELLEETLEMALKIGAQQKAITCHNLLSEIHKLKGYYQAAFEHLEKSHDVQSRLSGEEASNRIKHLQQKHATEQADKLAKLEQQKNVELKQAYDAIEDQNKSILDSINYARRIQTALLGSRTMLSKHVPENFVLYMPKDIVSGDFWWCAEEKDEFYFAVADCTGHGVPGAFMSLLNINLLNRALAENENASPAQLLNEVRRQVISSLNKEGSEEARDGMDVVLCAVNQSGRLRFACANNVLIHIRDGAMQIHGPDKFPVGLSHTYNPDPFSEFEIALQKGDCVYLSTDGFADQFGGKKGKKYKQKRLREFLQLQSLQQMKEQESILEKEFNEWRGNLEQVDDVLVLGLRWEYPFES